MTHHTFSDLLANGEDRIEGGHRLLEDHRHAVTAHVQQPLFGHTQQGFIDQQRVAGAYLGRGRQQAHQAH